MPLMGRNTVKNLGTLEVKSDSPNRCITIHEVDCITCRKKEGRPSKLSVFSGAVALVRGGVFEFDVKSIHVTRQDRLFLNGEQIAHSDVIEDKYARDIELPNKGRICF